MPKKYDISKAITGDHKYKVFKFDALYIVYIIDNI
mgnify:FL=1